MWVCLQWASGFVFVAGAGPCEEWPAEWTIMDECYNVTYKELSLVRTLRRSSLLGFTTPRGADAGRRPNPNPTSYTTKSVNH